MMTSSSVLPEEVSVPLQDLNVAIDGIETQLKELMQHPLSELTTQMDPFDAAKLNMLVAYAVNTLFYIYLKTQGVSPSDHPVKQELERIRTYIKKIKEHGEKNKAKEKASMKVDKEAANRFIKHSLAGNNEVKNHGKDDDGSSSSSSSDSESEGKGKKGTPAKGKKKGKRGQPEPEQPAKKSKRSELPSSHRSTPQPKSAHLAWKNASGGSTKEKVQQFLKKSSKK